MTAIASVGTAAATTATADATKSAATKQLAGNFDTFLTLLTTQLQNQDPLNPMDSSQFTQQLVQFSQVEQQIGTNDNLKTLIAQGQSQNSAYAVSYLGKTVGITDGTAGLSDGKANWAYTLESGAANSTLTVTDKDGKVVYTGPAEKTAGAHVFQWNGKTNGGTDLEDGTYKLTVAATSAEGQAITTQVMSKGTVSEVDMSGSEPQLIIGPMTVPLSKVTTVQTL
jgi:flagellar basal-body rod modification protein FlgD